MLRPYRQRRGPYAMARPSRGPSVMRFIVLLLIAGLILYFLGKFILGLFAGSASAERARVTMTVQETPVSVSQEGGLLQRIDDATTLYAGDRVTTGNGGSAELTMLDGTLVRMDEQSDVTVGVSERDEEESRFILDLAGGAVWVETPDLETFSGAIARAVQAGELVFEFGPGTQAVVLESAVLVFEDGGEGVTATDADGNFSVEVSEGQRFVVDGELNASSPGTHRSALTPEDWQDPFVVESLGRDPSELNTDTGSGAITGDDELLVLVPAEGAVVKTATVRVEGEVGDGVERVRINGYAATLNRSEGTFSQELAMPATGDMNILVEALNANGIVTQQVRRTVKREAAAPGAPTITEPAKTGETYTTQEQEIVIRGKVPAGTEGVMVNDYKLQLYKPGNADFSYLASVALGNLKAGSNVFDIYALSADGTKSPASRITIVLGGAVSSAGSQTSAASSVNEATLPQNDPLQPGTLRVTGPTAGTQHTATGSEVLIEGGTSADTATMWVNGYRLQLYQPGRRTWNYLAKTDFGNLKRGRNVYAITARDKDNRILDKMEYVITLDPR